MEKKGLLGELEDFSRDMGDLLGEEQAAPPPRPSIPPMVSAGNQELEEEETSERWTADVKEAADAAVREVASLTPRRLFDVLSQVVMDTYEAELQDDPDFFRTRFFVYSPLNMQSSMGPYHAAFDEPIGSVQWNELFDLIWHESQKKNGDPDRPRGIHIVHEPDHGEGPPFAVDISVDARGSIEQETTEADLWWTISLLGDGDPSQLPSRLAGTSRPVQAFGRAIEEIADRLGFPVSHESALTQLFHLLDPVRLSSIKEHRIEAAGVPRGKVLYEFNGRAEFRGRHLRVKLSDTSGFMLIRARDLHDSSIRYNLPLTHFSLSLREGSRTVVLERRFET